MIRLWGGREREGKGEGEGEGGGGEGVGVGEGALNQAGHSNSDLLHIKAVPTFHPSDRVCLTISITCTSASILIWYRKACRSFFNWMLLSVISNHNS